MITEIVVFTILIILVLVALAYAMPIVGCWGSGGYVLRLFPWPVCLGVGLS